MFPQTFAHFERQVQAGKIWIRRFEQLYNAHALTIVIESAVVLHAFRQHLLTGMPKGRVPEIMGERDRFRQVLVQSQRARDGATDRRDLDGMRQAGAQMIASPVKENLGLIFHAAEGAGMNDPGAIALKLGPISMARLGVFAAARFTRFLCKRREDGALCRLHLLPRFPAPAH